MKNLQKKVDTYESWNTVNLILYMTCKWWCCFSIWVVWDKSWSFLHQGLHISPLSSHSRFYDPENQFPSGQRNAALLWSCPSCVLHVSYCKHAFSGGRNDAGSPVNRQISLVCRDTLNIFSIFELQLLLTWDFWFIRLIFNKYICNIY